MQICRYGYIRFIFTVRKISQTFQNNFLMCCAAVSSEIKHFTLDRNCLWLRMFKGRLIKIQEVNNSKASGNLFPRYWPWIACPLSPNKYKQQNCWETWWAVLTTLKEAQTNSLNCPENPVSSLLSWPVSHAEPFKFPAFLSPHLCWDGLLERQVSFSQPRSWK